MGQTGTLERAAGIEPPRRLPLSLLPLLPRGPGHPLWALSNDHAQGHAMLADATEGNSYR